MPTQFISYQHRVLTCYYAFFMLFTRMLGGQHKPSCLGVGTDKIYMNGLDIRFPSAEDHLAPTPRWNPTAVLPGLLPSLPTKVFDRLFGQKSSQYTALLIVWKGVRSSLSISFCLNLD